MAQYNPNEYWNQQNPPDHSYNFEVPDDFGFQSFDNDPNQQPLSNQNQMYPNVPFTPTENVYTGQVYDPNLMPKTDQYSHGGGGGEFDDEPPLLEELGINPDHILKKTLSVLNPKEDPDPNLFNDTDMAGPLVFCLAFGAFLLLSGKVHFSYIYGIGGIGCLGMYSLLNLMSQRGATLMGVASVLGYCLLPMVLLSGVNVIASLQGAVGMSLSGLAILWCSFSAAKLFAAALDMTQQRVLVAYPCALLYGMFALITIF